MAYARGEYLVVWEQPAATLVPGVIRAQRVSAAGGLVDAAFDVSQRGIMGDASVGPSVAGDVSGWIVARRESGNSYTSSGAARMVGRLLPYANPAASGPEVPLDEARAGFFGLPALAAGTRGTPVAWRPLLGAAQPVARLAGAGGDAGAAVWDAAPAGVLATRSAELRFHSTRADARFECLVDEGAWQACASPLGLTGLTDRVHSATVRSVAPGGWVELVAATATRWRTEAAPPDTRITELPDPAAKQPEIAFAADEASLFDCRLDGGDWAYCAEFGWGKASLTGGFSFRGVADGPHVFEVRAIDESGRVEPEPARWVFTFDRREPETRIQAGPVTDAQWEGPVFELSSDEQGVRYECRRGDGTYDEWRPCASGQPVSGLGHAVDIRAVDAVGNVDWSPAEWGNGSYGVDTNVSTADGLDRAVVHIAPFDEGVTECSIDGEAFWRCPEDFIRFNNAPGAHQLRLRTVRFDGVVSDAGGRAFTIKAPVIPIPTIVNAPAAKTTSRSARVVWARSLPTGSFVCSVDGAAAQPCSSPLTLSGLDVGEHTVRIAGRGPNGEQEFSPDYYQATARWRVMVPGEPAPKAASSAVAADTGDAARAAEAVPPRALITALPRPWIATRDVELRFTADQAGSTFECLVDRGAWAPCTSPVRLTGLSEGTHQLQVRATAGGVTGPADLEEFYVDVTAPDTRISSPMLVDGMRTGLPFARFTVEHRQIGTEQGHAWLNDPQWVRCVLDGRLVGVCPERFDGLADGVHVLQAYAVDSAGNADPTPAVFTWVVGASEVDTRIESGPPAVSGSRSASFALSAAGADGFQCRLDGGAWEACKASVTLDALGDGSHRFEARAHAYNRADSSPRRRPRAR